MGTKNICDDIRKNKNNKEFRLLDDDKTSSNKGAERKISIIIKKTHKKNNIKNNSLIQNIMKEMDIKDNLNSLDIGEIQKKQTYDKSYKILKRSKTRKSIELSKIKKNVFDSSKESKHTLNKKYIKGQLIEKGKHCNIYIGLCTSNGEITTIKDYINLSVSKRKAILSIKEKMLILNHPNIIKILSIFEEDKGNINIVHESTTFKTVEQLMSKYGLLDEKIIQMYCRQLLKGLEYLHERKIYHKNLKPNNILVDIDGTIKISDYLIENIIIGNEKDFFDNLLNSKNIEYYIPPFFIQYIYNKYKKKENEKEKENSKNNKVDEINKFTEFGEWQAYDLWFVGCIILEVASGKKPWAYYNFKNNTTLFDFLKKTHLTPTVPRKISLECQELIQILLNHSLTNKPNIYNIIFNLNYFKSNNFTYEKNKGNISSIMNISDSQIQVLQSEETFLGNVLEKNKVVNVLNGNNNASFTITSSVITNEEKSFYRKNVIKQVNPSTWVRKTKTIPESSSDINILNSYI